MSNFKQMVKLLTDAGYNVKVNSESGYFSALVTGKGIRGGFCETNLESYAAINGKIAADNEECYNKWSQCPLKLEFPKTPAQEAKLLQLLEFLGSVEGEINSNNYLYLEGMNPYHYDA